MSDESLTDPKAMARRLREALADHDIAVSHSVALELVARTQGVRDWNTLAARPDATTTPPGAALAVVLRTVDSEDLKAVLLAAGFSSAEESGTLTWDQARVRVERHVAVPDAHPLLEVPDLMATHRSMAAAARDVTIGLVVGGSGSTDPARFLVRAADGAPILEVRARRSGRGVARSSAAIVAEVRVPSGQYSIADGGPSTWLLRSLFRRRTGRAPAILSTGNPRHTPRFVTGGTSVGNPTQVVLGTLILESNDPGTIALWLDHGPDVEPSRITVETHRVGDLDHVTLVHDQWTGSNRPVRGSFLDWQAELDRWAAGSPS